MNERIEKFLAKLPREIDAALLVSRENRFYMSGVASSDGMVLITREKSYLLVDFRYIQVAKENASGVEVVLLTNTKQQLAELVKRHRLAKIGIESEQMTVAQFKRFDEMLKPASLLFDGEVSKLLSLLRRTKSTAEIGFVKQAQEITDKTFEHICGFIKAGMTEKEVALELFTHAKKLGADSQSFDFIVVSGKNSSMPHGVPSDKKLENGDLVTMDFGVKVGGYCSDMTRTVAIGFVTDRDRRVYNTVFKAQLAALGTIKPGVCCFDIDKTARDIINEAGYTGCFGHGLGHSLGLEIHESPHFNTVCRDICENGMLMTVEPGVYIENEVGCRIEDMVYITEDEIINLTKSTKDLIIL